MVAQAPDLTRVKALLRSGDAATLRATVLRFRLQDAADVLLNLPVDDQAEILRALPPHAAAAIFEYLSTPAQRAVASALTHDDLALLLNDMAPDDRTLFLSTLPEQASQQLLMLLAPEERVEAQTLLGFAEGTVGRLMTTDFVAVRAAWTIAETLDFIRAHGQASETLDVIYVVDDSDMLVDDIHIRELLIVPVATRIEELMDRRFVALHASDDQAYAVEQFRREDRTALPVTDQRGTLIGIVTVDDVLDAAQAIATRELQHFGGSEALDAPYMEISLVRMVRKRAVWLVVLFLGEMLTATAMGFFEKEIARAVVLALFVPLIISSGGNSGSQASTLVIRALAVGEVTAGDWWGIVRREVFTGCALGAILGGVGFLRISIWSAFSSLYGPHWFLVALTVGVALFGVVLWGTLVGCCLPLVLSRVRVDPATSSAPFVATFVDVTGLVIYFSVAIAILRGTLL